MATDIISHEEFISFLDSYSHIFDIDIDLISPYSKYFSYSMSEARNTTSVITDGTSNDEDISCSKEDTTEKLPDEKSSYLMPYANLKGNKMILPIAPHEHQGDKRARSKSVCYVKGSSSNLLSQRREIGIRRRSECCFDQKEVMISPAIKELCSIGQ